MADLGDRSLFVEFVPEASHEEWLMKKRPLDTRILRVKEQHGKRAREWRDLVHDADESEFADWPLTGPRTTTWCLAFLMKQPGGAADHHHIWRRTAGLAALDFGVAEHEQLMEMVKHAGAYDQLNLANSAAFEVVFRRLQTIEYTHLERLRDKPKGGGKGIAGLLSSEELEAFAGTTKGSGAMVSPALLEYVQKDVQKKSDLMKSLLKAKEYREAVIKMEKQG